jgi:integrase
LATNRRVAASTQNQALAALLFLYDKVLDLRLPWLDSLVRARRPEHRPVVLSAGEVEALLGEMHGVTWIMASLLYGSGLRLMECATLRVKDVDLERLELWVRRGKGLKIASRHFRAPLCSRCASSWTAHESCIERISRREPATLNSPVQ